MKKVLLLWLGGCIWLNTFAQTKQHPLIPVSSTAASLGKYGDVDVSIYTGQINPPVKLLNIQFNDFAFPINLNYASSGLKVHEIPASVGMGMSISGTFAITRQVRNVPDEQHHGYNGLNPTATVVQSINAGAYTPTSAYSSITEENFKRGIGETAYDSEPDLFNFSLSENGGKFFFDETQIDSPTKLATTIPKQPLRIIANFNYSASGQLFNSQNQQGRIDDFEITDGKGIKYTFAKQEGALLNDDDYQFGKNIVSTWYLTKIETPNGNTLDFNYIQRTIDQPHAQSEYRYLYETSVGTGSLDSNPHVVVSQTTTTETVLQEILINGGSWGKVEFIEDENNRTDWAFSLSGTKPKALKEVRLKDGQNNLVRKFVFNYVDGANRLLLRSVQEFGATGTGNEPYVFDYYNESDIPTLPYGGSNVISREDNWGYYNANTTGTLLPTFEVVTTGAGSSISRTLSNIQFDKYLDSLKTTAISLQEKPDKNAPNTIQASYVYFITATNRNPDFNSALIGQLKKITYPTKGFTEFIYEANSYYGKNDEVFNPCSGNYQSIGAVSKTFTSGEFCPISNTTTFTVSEGAYSCMKVDWSINLNSPNQDIIDGEVFIINDNTGIIYSQHTLSCNNGATESDGGSNYVVLPAGNYTAHASLCREVSGSNTSLASIDVQAIPTVIGSAYSTRTSGGVRIKEMRDCPNDNTNDCIIKEYTYTPENDPDNSSGRIVTNGRYSYPVQYFTTDNGGNFVNANYLNSASQLPLSTTLGQYIGYNTVIVKEAKLVEGIKVYKGKTVYDYRSPDENEVPDVNSGSFPYWDISYDWKRGVIEQMKVYDQAGDWLKNDQNQYVLKTSLNYSKYTSIKAGKFIHNIEASPNGYNPNVYAFKKYQSVSGFHFNQQSTNQERFKVNSNFSTIESITQYTYGNDNHLQLTQTSTTNSKGESMGTQYKYPNDITSGDLQATATLLATRKTELLETETFLNGSSINKTQNFFSNFGGKTLPSSQKTFIGGSSNPATESLQLSYDSYGNPVSFKAVGGATNSFLWGYNGQYPVIYIANGTPPDASALLTTFDASTIESTANSLRGSLPNAHISSYTFKPMVGMLCSTAPNLLKTSFSFDALNRLDRVFDHDNNIVKAYQYQYASSLGGSSFVKELIPRIGSNSLVSGYQNIQTTLAYVDGLGRTLQTVAQQAGAGGTNDIVSNAVSYDGYSRIEKTYIPFPNSGNGALASLPSSVHGDLRPFTENIEFDNSPLNRLFKVRGVGDAWLSANKFSESTVEVSGGVRSYSVASNGTVSSGTYPANSLYKKTNKDEQGNISIEYTDKEGRLVQKEQQLNATDYAITAYIYNNNGQLAFIVQPEAYNTATNFDKNSTIFPLGVFGYEYDDRGRQIAKHVPSGGWTYSVYDKLNREVLSQTELQRPDNKWRFIKFDAINRTLQKGDLANASSRNDLQNLFNTITNAYEEGSSNQSFPSSVSSSPTQQREAFIYDDYGFIAGEWMFNRANTYHDNYANAKGLLTGAISWNSGDFSKVYHTVYHYDSKGRVIQTYQTHQLGGSQPWTKANIGNFYYNFNGQVLIDKKILQKENSPNIEDKTENEYDHVGRLTKVFHSINGNRFEVVRLSYDQVGRLIQKKFRADENFLIGGTLDYINRPPSPNANIDDIARKAIFLNVGTVIDATSINKYSATINPNAPQGVSISGLQTMDFSHHIRGGLRGINLDGSGNPTPNATEGDLFSYKLDYETAGFYDGNIGKQSWQTTANNSPVGVRSFTLGYDASSRLKYANYSGFSGESFGLPNINYDKNSNITNLQRNGKKGSGYGDIDNLTYSYTGNRLNTVTDGVSGNHEVDLIQRGGGNYTYYNDGSLKSDENERISNIVYDTYLDQPNEITLTDGSKINHYYNGSGELLKTVYSTGEYWDFIDDMIYKNGLYYQIGTPEGRAIYQNNVWEYEYFYQDHLGNTRIAFKANGSNLEKTSETAFDAFGVVLKGAEQVNNFQNRFEMQGKERESTFGLNRINLGARTYNPTIGRLDRVDIMAEKWNMVSTYSYGLNNPILFIDPDGRDIILSYSERNKKGKMITRTITYHTGMKAQGPESLRQTIEGLNFIAKKDGDFLEKVSKSDLFRIDIKIDPTAEQSSNLTLLNGDGNPMKGNSGKYETGIYFGSNAGYVDENNNTHSPISALYHELEHSKLKFEEAKVFNNAKTAEQKRSASNWMARRNNWSGGATDIAGYMNNEEYYTTRKEAEFQSKYLGEQARPNHRGTPYQTTGVFSRTPLNGIIPKFKPRKR